MIGWRSTVQCNLTRTRKQFSSLLVANIWSSRDLLPHHCNLPQFQQTNFSMLPRVMTLGSMPSYPLNPQTHQPHIQSPLIHPPFIQNLLDTYQDVFQDPQTLPPPRSYDHAIPLTPRAVPVNARPYHYSSQHKTKIEDQVKQLLQSGFITHSHRPFASPVLQKSIPYANYWWDSWWASWGHLLHQAGHEIWVPLD
jgi:hypothetical protein